MTDPEHNRLEHLYRHYSAMVRRRALSILRNDTDVDDAAQDTFLKASRYIGRFTDDVEDDQNRILLLVMAKHAAVDILRRRKPTVSISERDIDANASLDALDDAILHSKTADTLLRELYAHNKKAAEAFLLQQLYGFTHREIADMLGVGVGYSQKLVMHAKASMRESARRRGWIVALILALVMLLAACGYIFREALKEAFEQFTTYWIQAERIEAVESPDWQYVANGFQFKDSICINGMELYVYENAEGDSYIVQFETAVYFHVDSENAQLSAYEIGGYTCEIYSFDEKDIKAIMVVDGTTVYITGSISEQEALAIMQSILHAKEVNDLKKFLGAFLAITLVFCLAAPQAAARWSYISSISNSIIVSGGTANMRVTVTADSSITKITVSSVLEKQVGTSWEYVDTYTATFNTYYGGQNWSRSNCSGSYRLVTTVKVYIGTTLKETATVTAYS